MKYGNGTSLVTACTLDKEEIRHALKGEIVCDIEEDRIHYRKGTKEECEEVVLSNYNEAVFQLIEATRANKVFERYLKDRGLVISLPEFIELRGIIESEENETFDYGEE